MLWSGSAPRAVLRDSMWGFLMFAGVAWLAIAWSVLRLEPSDIAGVAGPVILFGALCEGVRALAGTRTWWLNAGMGGLFAITGLLMLLVGDATFATPAALVGWYLMVRGAMDVAVSTMNRGADRTWGLVLALGVAQAGLGFVAAGPLTRTADAAVLVLGGLGVLRGVADLVTALRLREVSGVRHDVLQLSPEREAGVAGYSAGLIDFEEQPKPDFEPHRQPASASASDGETWQHGYQPQPQHGYEPQPQHGYLQPQHALGDDGELQPGDQPPLRAAYEDRPQHEAQPDRARHRAQGSAGPAGPGSAGPVRSSFHDEVVRSTRDLDAVIAEAGVTGTGAPAHRIPDNLPPAPDTAEGVVEAVVAEDYRR